MVKHGMKRMPLRERLMQYVQLEGECWIWTGAKDPKGYGRINYNGHAKSALAHRVAYMEFVGPIPDGLELDHLCRNPSCINPEHLEPVSRSINMKRGLAGTSPRFRNYWLSKTHCPRGHPYDLLNTYFDSKGHRFCRQCHRARQIKLYWRRRNGDTEKTKPWDNKAPRN